MLPYPTLRRSARYRHAAGAEFFLDRVSIREGLHEPFYWVTHGLSFAFIWSSASANALTVRST
jgi:hypothetical protein